MNIRITQSRHFFVRYFSLIKGIYFVIFTVRTWVCHGDFIFHRTKREIITYFFERSLKGAGIFSR